MEELPRDKEKRYLNRLRFFCLAWDWLPGELIHSSGIRKARSGNKLIYPFDRAKAHLSRWGRTHCSG
jgi:hypothetical protein